MKEGKKKKSCSFDVTPPPPPTSSSLSLDELNRKHVCTDDAPPGEILFSFTEEERGVESKSRRRRRQKNVDI